MNDTESQHHAALHDRIRLIELERDLEAKRRKRNTVTLVGLLIWIFLGVPACGAIIRALDGM